MSNSITWDVVATVKAAPEHIESFWQHYLRLGASRVFLFLDDPACQYHPEDHRVTIIRADAENRPPAVEDRQTANATHAARISQAEWILHCDVDEYLATDAHDQSVSQVLSHAPADANALLVPPTEPIYLSFPETFTDILSARYFKVKMPDMAAAELFWAGRYGDLNTLSTAGFWAHRRGKSLYRTALARRGKNIPLHGYSRARARKLGQKDATGLNLRHFDALTFESWLAKHRGRIDGSVQARMAGSKRNALSQRVTDVLAREGLEGAQELFFRMFGADQALLNDGLAQGFIAEHPPLRAALL